MIDFHRRNKPLVTLAVKNRDTSRSLLFDDNMQLVGWRDNTNGSIRGLRASEAAFALGFSTVHVIDPALFSQVIERGAFSIIDLYLRLMEKMKILGFRHDSSAWMEFGRIEKILELPKTDDFIEIIRHL
jgi:NDP-sugar pyrophosphorylase family protein